MPGCLGLRFWQNLIFVKSSVSHLAIQSTARRGKDAARAPASCADGSWASSREASRATGERPWPPRAKPGSGLSSTPDPRPAGWSAADTPSPTRSGRSYPARLWSTDAPRPSWSIPPWMGRGRRRSASPCISSRRPAVASGSARARSTRRRSTPSRRRTRGAGRRRRRWSARRLCGGDRDVAAPITRRRGRFSHRQPRRSHVCNILLNASHVYFACRPLPAAWPRAVPLVPSSTRGMERSWSWRELNDRLPPRLVF